MKVINRAAFTLIEILLVVVIIATLTAFFGRGLYRQFAGAKSNITKIGMKSVQDALLQYNLHMGHYPSSREGGLEALQAPPTPRGDWDGPYIEGAEPPKDAWKNEYEYNAPPARYRNKFKYYELISYGANGVEGGDGNDADISVGL